MTEVRLASVRFACDGVSLFELAAERALPPVAPGSHLELELPNGLRRPYFIAERSRMGTYTIGVRREPDGHASKYLHDKVKVGASMRVAVASGAALDDSARSAVVIAEDVGIFYAWSVVRALDERDAAWTLLYDAWSAKDAPLLAALRAYGSRARVHLRGEHRGRGLDWDAIVATFDAETRVYAAGSPEWQREFAASLSRDVRARGVRVVATSTVQPRERGPVEFDVVLARSGVTVPVRRDESILEALRGAGIAAPHFCLAGICGTCRTRVLEGVPRHLDAVLSAPERASNEVMMICRSRTDGPRLVLDL